jgi:predicted metal-dependent hydrolase
MIDASTKWYELAPNIAKDAFDDIRRQYPLKDGRRIVLKYSGHLKNYNSNARYNADKIEFSLSNQWKDVDADIQKGLIQSLIIRVFKIRNVETENMKLYESFMKNLSKYAKKHTQDPELSLSFDRVNGKYFNGMMDKPNLIFASESFSKLGSYEYGTDTIHISTIFHELPEDDVKYLDYVMYHELLHKKHSFNVKNGRHQAHTTAFRNDERNFAHGIDMEKQLSAFLRRKRYSKAKGSMKEWFRMW